MLYISHTFTHRYIISQDAHPVFFMPLRLYPRLQHCMSMMHNTSPRAAASLGQWMKNIATALFVAIFTDRALLVQHRGGISFTEHFAAPCFDWEYEAVVPRMHSVPTANNTYRLTSHVLRAKQPTALPWHEHYKLLQSGDLAGETAAYPFLQVDIAKFVLPLLAQNPRYSVEIHNLFGVNAVSHVYRLLFSPNVNRDSCRLDGSE